MVSVSMSAAAPDNPSAAVMLRYTPSVGQFSAVCSQLSSLQNPQFVIPVVFVRFCGARGH